MGAGRRRPVTQPVGFVAAKAKGKPRPQRSLPPGNEVEGGYFSCAVACNSSYTQFHMRRWLLLLTKCQGQIADIGLNDDDTAPSGVRGFTLHIAASWSANCLCIPDGKWQA